MIGFFLLRAQRHRAAGLCVCLTELQILNVLKILPPLPLQGDQLPFSFHPSFWPGNYEIPHCDKHRDISAINRDVSY